MPASPLGPIPGLGYAESISTHALTRLSDGSSATDSAPIAEEIPVAFVYNTESFVVVMASPTDLEDLAVGFSITEGIVDRPSDVDSIEVIRQSRGIELQIAIPEASGARLAARRRGLNGRTGCGLCGIEAIDEVLKQPTPVPSGATFKHDALWRAAAELQARQPINNETRAVHAAAFADRVGRLLVVREDVGRHNALDKVIGHLALHERVPATDTILTVSGRVSYEIVQKAAVAGIPVLCAVSAPSSLAVDAARRVDQTVVGFLRGDRFNIYTHPDRVDLTA